MKCRRLSERRAEADVPVKINLTLDVLRKRADGYHEIETLMAEVPWGDRISVELSEKPGVDFECDLPELCNSSNSACKAAEAYLRRSPFVKGVRVLLNKVAPVGAGLGGGSADAAAVSLLLNELNPSPLPLDDLVLLQSSLGSDNVFFGGVCICKGRGEIVEPVAPALPYSVYLILPPFSISTKSVYENFKFPLKPARLDIKENYSQILNPLKVERMLRNDLETAAFALHPSLAEIKKRLSCRPRVLGAQLSGSGSALFVLASANTKDDSSALSALCGCRVVFVPA